MHSGVAWKHTLDVEVKELTLPLLLYILNLPYFIINPLFCILSFYDTHLHSVFLYVVYCVSLCVWSFELNRSWLRTLLSPAEKTLVSNRIEDYVYINQGKTRIPGVNDCEEMLLTDVSGYSNPFLPLRQAA
jgi:hypothetical protein